jgi:hypothetical protein
VRNEDLFKEIPTGNQNTVDASSWLQEMRVPVPQFPLTVELNYECLAASNFPADSSPGPAGDRRRDHAFKAVIADKRYAFVSLCSFQPRFCLREVATRSERRSATRSSPELKPAGTGGLPLFAGQIIEGCV